MKFSFSLKFRLSLYSRILKDLAKELDTYREISGTNLTEMMDAIHISYPILKKFVRRKNQ